VAGVVTTLRTSAKISVWKLIDYTTYRQPTRCNNNGLLIISQLNMFWAIILPIFRSTRPCFTACGIMHPQCCRPAGCNTHSSAPEDGQNNCPKHVELTVIVNKLLLLHLVGCLYYLYK